MAPTLITRAGRLPAPRTIQCTLMAVTSIVLRTAFDAVSTRASSLELFLPILTDGDANNH